MKVIENCEGFAISRTMQEVNEEVVRQFQRGLLRPFLTQGSKQLLRLYSLTEGSVTNVLCFFFFFFPQPHGFWTLDPLF